MKKIIPALSLTLASFAVGCTDSEYVYTSYYQYRNESSREISLRSYHFANGPVLSEDTLYSSVIPVGKTHTLRFDTEGGFPYPFMWNSPTGSDYVIVSNGEKQFVHTRSAAAGGENRLFREECYEIIGNHPKNRDRTYRYTFTDRDFEEAEPVEP